MRPTGLTKPFYWQTKTSLSLLIFCLAALSWLPGLLSANNFDQKAPEVARALLDSLNLTAPVILDIRCREWTSTLEKEIRSQLLKRQADIREPLVADQMAGNNPDSLASLSLQTGTALLDALSLRQAVLLQVDMEQNLINKDKRRPFSYQRYRIPVYDFYLKQVLLPGQQLLNTRSYRISDPAEPEQPGSILSMKWYEPLVATAVVASLVIMLWTLH